MYSSTQQVDDHLEHVDNSRWDIPRERHYQETLDLKIWEQAIDDEFKQMAAMEMMGLSSFEEYESYWNRTLEYYKHEPEPNRQYISTRQDT